MARRKPYVVEGMRDVAGFFGVNEKTISGWHLAGCPCKGGPYDLYLIAEWWAINRQSNRTTNADAELKTRRLEQQIRSEQLDYDERIGELMPLSHVQTILNSQSIELRKAGELLLRQFGDDAQLVILEAIDSMDHALTHHFKDDRKV